VWASTGAIRNETGGHNKSNYTITYKDTIIIYGYHKNGSNESIRRSRGEDP
jgi:hypothetical protein